jgi:hypothetical protein
MEGRYGGEKEGIATREEEEASSYSKREARTSPRKEESGQEGAVEGIGHHRGGCLNHHVE